jgi:hypothetical protein
LSLVVYRCYEGYGCYSCIYSAIYALRAIQIQKEQEPVFLMVSLKTLEQKSLRTERAFQENSHDPNILLALNPTLVSGYAHHSLHRRTTNRPNITQRDNTAPHMQSLQANSIAGPSSSPHNPHPSFGHPAGDRKPNGHWDGKPASTMKNTEHLKKLRELNKCFECEQTGHMAKDCPRCHSLPHRPGPRVTGL